MIMSDYAITIATIMQLRITRYIWRIW